MPKATIKVVEDGADIAVGETIIRVGRKDDSVTVAIVLLEALGYEIEWE